MTVLKFGPGLVLALLHFQRNGESTRRLPHDIAGATTGGGRQHWQHITDGWCDDSAAAPIHHAPGGHPRGPDDGGQLGGDWAQALNTLCRCDDHEICRKSTGRHREARRSTGPVDLAAQGEGPRDERLSLACAGGGDAVAYGDVDDTNKHPEGPRDERLSLACPGGGDAVAYRDVDDANRQPEGPTREQRHQRSNPFSHDFDFAEGEDQVGAECGDGRGGAGRQREVRVLVGGFGLGQQLAAGGRPGNGQPDR
mmetsp:Transcript_161128/g.517125  ORF Transcript_161128/g.517125 Transcript_161128/m.517125 type:complete len:253 (+) Transcript_161128:3-761(+)